MATSRGFCECGCGERTSLAPQTHRGKGWVKGQPLRFVFGHQHRGRSRELPHRVESRGYETPCWISLRTTANRGYGVVAVPGTGSDAVLLTAEMIDLELVRDRAVCLDVGEAVRRHVPRLPLAGRLGHGDHLEAVTPQENTRRYWEKAHV